MSSLHSRLLLLAALLLLGWGIASWLEEGAPWSSLPRHTVETAADGSQVDVRVLIQEEVRRQREPAAISSERNAAAETEIRLMSGSSPETVDSASPAWLTGEIEP